MWKTSYDPEQIEQKGIDLYAQDKNHAFLLWDTDTWSVVNLVQGDNKVWLADLIGSFAKKSTHMLSCFIEKSVEEFWEKSLAPAMDIVYKMFLTNLFSWLFVAIEESKLGEEFIDNLDNVKEILIITILSLENSAETRVALIKAFSWGDKKLQKIYSEASSDMRESMQANWSNGIDMEKLFKLI